MSVASQYLYCSENDVMARLSADGVTLRLDDDDNGVVDMNEQQAMTDALSDASETINFYTWMKYDPSVLVGNPWVNRRCVDLAAYILCGRRANPIPDSVLSKAQQAEKYLQEIADGPRLIPLAPLRRRLAPVWSNNRIVAGYQFKCIRVETQTSSPPSKGVPQNPDWASTFCFEI